jgi:hypothetical protein
LLIPFNADLLQWIPIKETDMPNTGTVSQSSIICLLRATGSSINTFDIYQFCYYFAVFSGNQGRFS